MLCACSVTQLCLALCDPMDCSPPGSSVHGIFQVRILEWVAISYFRGSSWPRDQTDVSCVSGTGRQILYHCTAWVALSQQLLSSPLFRWRNWGTERLKTSPRWHSKWGSELEFKPWKPSPKTYDLVTMYCHMFMNIGVGWFLKNILFVSGL